MALTWDADKLLLMVPQAGVAFEPDGSGLHVLRVNLMAAM